jgi:N utilization substance protein B
MDSGDTNPAHHRSPPGPARRQRRKSPRGSTVDRRARGARRHQARILALQILFEVDLTAHDVLEVLARTLTDQDVPEDIRTYADRLVRGALAHREEIDRYIATAAPAFPVRQLPLVDRNVLRIAIYELLHERDVPIKAAINEAVELAKRFGGDNSSRFVNGVLGTVAGQITRDGMEPARTNGSGDQ